MSVLTAKNYKMKELFVSFEIALKLKELGFNEPCLLVYGNKKLCPIAHTESTILLPCIVNKQLPDKIVAAPLYQQVFKWFRDKYDITQTIARDGSLAKEGRWAYTIVADGIYFNDGYNTYEEAETECIKKLIEIVQTQAITKT